ncbi:protein rough sheath 2 homolog [Amborella trichopoda]|uniref:Asymmetric leaves 1 n=1 Tax=Amborella trichopoda TaxID=13333 RepID=U5CVC8_AMBTC|nr:protein rough sheath 2 homolog [Amborella trichopoda]ERN17286.1 hypothetical protein AMTR_s00044p00233260 [Amborella trichopoda]QOQ51787.1 asymmetric leaves 1 [Amborella trichopoda]|eukprot:XP_006855819.1 protein rough sheath 2 homolog [Amborella trichopoda]
MKERQRWQPEEDALLRAYVKQYGPKEWNLVSQRMGRPLHRDAKSCLERWKNYLKPGIKKGSLSQEEQALVVALQAKYGNKWKKIAAEVPGRTAKRLGKWWEVFKEKQAKDKQRRLQQNHHHHHHHQQHSSSISSQQPPVGLSSDSSSVPVSGRYDHILETFAEKYAQQAKSCCLPPPPPPPLLSDPTPLLSLNSAGTTTQRAPAATETPALLPSLPPWLSAAGGLKNFGAVPSVSPPPPPPPPPPSVSLSLSPTSVATECTMQAAASGVVQQLAQWCREVEEGRQAWVQQKKEAAWRVRRVEQQLESEKSRKRREKMEEVEAKIRRLREEEAAFVDRLEADCREQLAAVQRDAEMKEVKLMEQWAAKHLKLATFVEHLSSQHPSSSCFLKDSLL